MLCSFLFYKKTTVPQLVKNCSEHDRIKKTVEILVLRDTHILADYHGLRHCTAALVVHRLRYGLAKPTEAPAQAIFGRWY